MPRAKKVKSSDDVKLEGKKRGRKPKGGKLITNDIVSDEPVVVPANIICHLNCSLSDAIDDNSTAENCFIGDPMNYNASVPPTVMAYDHAVDNNRFYNLVSTTTSSANANAYNKDVELPSSQSGKFSTLCNKCKLVVDEPSTTEPNVDMKEVNQKLKQLKLNLYKNQMDEKRAACFWCTYEFDNQPCYIPRYSNDGSYFGYGSFCRPECAVGYLMKETLDDSTKFERYHLLNSIYAKVYNYTNNIKPAPNPYYLLDKFYGNLTIQEYRKLLRSERMLMVVDSPLTRILPELHEDTDDYITDVYGGNKSGSTQAGGVYKVKRPIDAIQTIKKSDIMKEKFGLV